MITITRDWTGTYAMDGVRKEGVMMAQRIYSRHPDSIRKRAWYARQKEENSASYQCLLAYQRGYQRMWVEQRRWRQYQGPRVAHCGQWHYVTGIPFTTPCCGAVLFEELVD